MSGAEGDPDGEFETKGGAPPEAAEPAADAAAPRRERTQQEARHGRHYAQHVRQVAATHLSVERLAAELRGASLAVRKFLVLHHLAQFPARSEAELAALACAVCDAACTWDDRRSQLWLVAGAQAAVQSHGQRFFDALAAALERTFASASSLRAAAPRNVLSPLRLWAAVHTRARALKLERSVPRFEAALAFAEMATFGPPSAVRAVEALLRVLGELLSALGQAGVDALWAAVEAAGPVERLCGVAALLDYLANPAFPARTAGLAAVRGRLLQAFDEGVLTAQQLPRSFAFERAFAALFPLLSQDEFKAVVAPSVSRMLRRFPGVVSRVALPCVRAARVDLGPHVAQMLSPALADLATGPDAERRDLVALFAGAVLRGVRDASALRGALREVMEHLTGARGPLAAWEQRAAFCRVLVEATATAPPASAESAAACAVVAPEVVTELLAFLADKESHIDARRAALLALGAWARLLSVDAAPPAQLQTALVNGLQGKGKDAGLESVHAELAASCGFRLRQLGEALSSQPVLLDALKLAADKPQQHRLRGLHSAVLLLRVARNAKPVRAALDAATQSAQSFVNAPDLIAKASAEECNAHIALLVSLLASSASWQDADEKAAAAAAGGAAGGAAAASASVLPEALWRGFALLLVHPLGSVRRTSVDLAESVVKRRPAAHGALLSALTWVVEHSSGERRPMVLAHALLRLSRCAPQPAHLVALGIMAHRPALRGGRVWPKLVAYWRKADRAFDVKALLRGRLEEIREAILRSRDAGVLSASADARAGACGFVATVLSLLQFEAASELAPAIRELLASDRALRCSAYEMAVLRTPAGQLCEWRDPSAFVAQAAENKGNVTEDELWEKQLRAEQQAKGKPAVAAAAGAKLPKGLPPAAAAQAKRERERAAEEQKAREAKLQDEQRIRDEITVSTRRLRAALELLRTCARLAPEITHRALVVETLGGVLPLLRGELVSDDAVATLRALTLCLDRAVRQPLALPHALRVVVSAASPRALWADANAADAVHNALELVRGSSPSAPLLSPASMRLVLPLIEARLTEASALGVSGSGEEKLSVSQLAPLEPALDILCANCLPQAPPAMPRREMASLLLHVTAAVAPFRSRATSALLKLAPALDAADMPELLEERGLLSPHPVARAAALQALGRMNALAPPHSDELTCRIYLACFDPSPEAAAAAKDLWTRFEFRLPEHYAPLLTARLAHPEAAIRSSACGAMAGGMLLFPQTVAAALRALLALFAENVDQEPGAEAGEPRALRAVSRALTRAGVAECLGRCVEALNDRKLLVEIFSFLTQRALGDLDNSVWEHALESGLTLIQAHGREHIGALLPLFEERLRTLQSDRAATNAAAAAASAAAQSAAATAAEAEAAAAGRGGGGGGGGGGGKGGGKGSGGKGGKGGKGAEAMWEDDDSKSDSAAKAAVAAASAAKAAAAAAAQRAAQAEVEDRMREGAAVFLGTIAQFMARDNAKLLSVVDSMLSLLQTPSHSVQRAVAEGLSPLMPAVESDAPRLVAACLQRLRDAETFGARKGAAFGLAAMVKGLKLSSMRKYGVLDELTKMVQDRSSVRAREGAMMAYERLFAELGANFEPYLVTILPHLLECFGDSSADVREATQEAARRVMSVLTGHGVKMVMPQVLNALEQPQWRARVHSIEMLGSMAFCAPHQLSAALPMIVPRLLAVLSDPHNQVREAAAKALEQIGSVIRNPEIAALVPTLLEVLRSNTAPVQPALRALIKTSFVHSVDPASLALIVPIIRRGLNDRDARAKKMACQVVGSICSLLQDVKDMAPYSKTLLKYLKAILFDSSPDVRSLAAVALGSLFKGLGEEHFEGLFEWLTESMQQPDSSTVQRSGAAQGMAQVMLALGIDKVQERLPQIFEACRSPQPRVREGYVLLLEFLPVAFGDQFAFYLPQVLPVVLRALSDDDGGVRDAALRAGQAIVMAHSVKSKDALLPPLSEGLVSPEWRVREGSAVLVGGLLRRVVGFTRNVFLGQYDPTDEDIKETLNSVTTEQERLMQQKLGREAYNQLLATVYLMRSDPTTNVKQVAWRVWKSVVQNTPRTLRSVFSTLMNNIIFDVASADQERQAAASSALGDLVRKTSGSVLEQIIPILQRRLRSPDGSARRGVCLALREVMISAPRSQVSQFLPVLIAAVRDALCDELDTVRLAASATFATLFSTIGRKAIDEIVPSFLRKLKQVSGHAEDAASDVPPPLAASEDAGAEAAEEKRAVGDEKAKDGARDDSKGAAPRDKSAKGKDAAAASPSGKKAKERSAGGGKGKKGKGPAKAAVAAAADEEDDDEAGGDLAETRPPAEDDDEFKVDPAGLAAEGEAVAGEAEEREEQLPYREPSSELVLQGIRQVLGVCHRDVLPYLIPALAKSPLPVFYAQALAALSDQFGGSFYRYVIQVLTVLVDAMAAACDEQELQDLREAGNTIVVSVGPDCVHMAIDYLLERLRNDKNKLACRACADLLGALCGGSQCELTPYAASILRGLLATAAEEDEAVQVHGASALQQALHLIPQSSDDHAVILPLLESMQQSLDALTKDHAGRVVRRALPGLRTAKATIPFIDALWGIALVAKDMAPSCREAACALLCDVLSLSTEEGVEPAGKLVMTALNLVSVQAPGVRAQMLRLMDLVQVKARNSVRLVAIQMPRAFLKALVSEDERVREYGAAGLANAVTLQKRAPDLIFNELLSTVQAQNSPGVRTSCLQTLRLLLGNGELVALLQQQVVQRVFDSMAPLMQDEAESVALASSQVLGATAGYMQQRQQYLQDLLQPVARASLRRLRLSALQHLAVVHLASLDEKEQRDFVQFVSLRARDDDATVRIAAATLCLEVAICSGAKKAPQMVARLLALLATVLGDPINDVRLAACMACARLARESVELAQAHLEVLVPALVARADKDLNGPVRRNAQHALFYLMNFHQGVDAAQDTLNKYGKRAEASDPEGVRTLVALCKRLSKLDPAAVAADAGVEAD